MKQFLIGAAMAAATLTTAWAQSGEMADGEVRKIDRDAGKITLKHGDIKSLDMPPMTMVFAVRDKALLGSLQPGDKVKFQAVSEAGKIIVTKIEAAR